MIGVIIGNVVGSIYHSEQKRIKTKKFIFFSDVCHFRIDTITRIDSDYFAEDTENS